MRRRNRRPQILPKVYPMYESGGMYPDRVRICFGDGETRIYRIEQPAFTFEEFGRMYKALEEERKKHIGIGVINLLDWTEE